jgi:serine/threonine protein kinase
VNYQAWRVDYTDFEEIRQIGGGVSAVVFYGRLRRTGGEVAIKKFKYQKLNGSKLQSFQREVACLATATHPAVLKLIGATAVCSTNFTNFTGLTPPGARLLRLTLHEGCNFFIRVTLSTATSNHSMSCSIRDTESASATSVSRATPRRIRR